MTSTPVSNPEADAAALGFSPIENEPPLRWMRRLRLVPPTGLGVVRRAVALTLLAWLPLVAWAALTGRLLNSTDAEPLLHHFGIHARFLLAVPLLVLAEAPMHAMLPTLLRGFVSGGLIDEELKPRFQSVLRKMIDLRNMSHAWVVVFALVLAWLMLDNPPPRAHDLAWAAEADGSRGFGALWLAYVSRPILLVLLLGWLWRLILVVVLFFRINRLGLILLPTHPDQFGGLLFVLRLPQASALVTLALMVIICSRWAHDTLYHGRLLVEMKFQIGLFAILWSLFLLLPLLLLSPAMAAAKRRAELAYASLVGIQGQLVERRWIEGKPIGDDERIEPTGIGCMADAAAVFQAVKSMRPVPIGVRSLLPILIPMTIPVLVVISLRVPLKQELLALLKLFV